MNSTTNRAGTCTISALSDQNVVAKGNEADGGGARKVQILVKLDNSKTHCLNFVVPTTTPTPTPTPASQSQSQPQPQPLSPPKKCASQSTKKNVESTPYSSSSSSSPFDFLPVSVTQILDKLSLSTGIPQFMLKLNNKYQHQHHEQHHKHKHEHETSITGPFFLSAYTFLPIRGGKGGFGTLLKGQSKQAGAKRTMDFGACRDLNGRRLRHINDEVKLRKWRESVQKKVERANNNDGSGGSSGGDGTGLINIEEEIEQLKTASGIRNWHLMVPNWSDAGGGGLSSKSRNSIERKLRREVENLARQTKQEHDQRLKKKEAWQQSIVSYAKAGEEYAKEQDKKMTNSILEGLSKRKKRKLGDGSSNKADSSNEGAKRNNVGATAGDEDEDEGDSTSSILGLSSVCTLSGDVVVEDGKSANSEGSMMVQSKSEFATSAILLSLSLLNGNDNSSGANTGLYYEVTVKTCGIAQIGWALIPKINGGLKLPATEGFAPNSDTGDGVGDDSFSYGFDGSRGLAFHDGKEKKFGKSGSRTADDACWKDGDVVGCMYDFKNGTIQYSINGDNLGVAFNIEPCSENSLKERLLCPVLSLNENEIIGLNIGPTFQYCPKDYTGVSTLLGSNEGNSAGDDKNTKNEENTAAKQDDQTTMHPMPTEKAATSGKNETTNKQEKKDEATEKHEAINLNDFNSATELENLGADRLKNELHSLGCKCGGSLQERAQRLFSLKGLEREQFPKKIRGKNFVV
eukprot:CAMPEP_0203663672 /NCGR_PEP_ID=MMETSP0090-20130426/1222_1 /ASSEMBLY_ACC=CAM_ASM_001088 /TAXON_ID=426623 /ORGANISM="Chaetoceros affinis, Strain CCMP159" /LENGTH=742 /DNA_ID=CAMNT_0050526663 /DNA_START=72 /DNA_END=2300 /DNA_ORIENTATION=-